MRNAKPTMNTPKAIVHDMHEHGNRPADAMLLVTRTDHIPLVFGSGDETPGQIIDNIIREGNISKITLDLEKDNF
jgi:hypothetical protein